MWCSFLPPYAADMRYQFLAAGPSSLHWHLTATVFMRAPSQARMESIERCTPDMHVSEQIWRLARLAADCANLERDVDLLSQLLLEVKKPDGTG